MTLSEFLLARIAEDEVVAREVMSPAPWSVAHDDFETAIDNEGEWAASTIVGTITHIVRHDPARVLAECEAKRRVVELHSSCGCNEDMDGVVWDDGPCPTLRALALPDADHPDFREEWRP